jgi:hypothetical protein
MRSASRLPAQPSGERQASFPGSEVGPDVICPTIVDERVGHRPPRMPASLADVFAHIRAYMIVDYDRGHTVVSFCAVASRADSVLIISSSRRYVRLT